MENKLIRVAYLIRRTSGGMQTHIIGLLSKLDQNRFHPIVISPKAPKLTTILKKEEIEYYEAEIEDRISPKADLVTARSVARVLREIEPDILHVHGNKAAVISWLASRLIPIKKTIITVHNFPSNLNPSLKYYLVSKQANRAILNGADILIAVSSEIRNCLENEVGIDPAKIEIIPNGIDVERWKDYKEQSKADIRDQLGLPKESILIGTVGRLVPFKGHSVLIKSMARLLENHTNIYLLVLGDGPLRDRLEEQAKELRISHAIKFLGFVDDPGRYLPWLNIFAFPSVREPFGIVLLEAMTLGIPVVAANAGGIPDIVIDGESGMLAESGDEVSLAEAIEALLTSRNIRNRLIENAKKRVSDEFTVDLMTQRTMALYEKVMDSGNPEEELTPVPNDSE